MNTDWRMCRSSTIRLIAGRRRRTSDHLQMYEANTQESLRGRTGGAVTLAVGMADIFDQAARRLWPGSRMAEAAGSIGITLPSCSRPLFILTTIDAGTRIGRFLLQEIAGKIDPKLGQTSWCPAPSSAPLLIVVGWVYFIQPAPCAIWPMFGIANQMLAVIALAIISVYLVNEGKTRYVAMTIIPMLVVATTTTTAAVEMLANLWANTLQPQSHNFQKIGDNPFWAMFHAGIQSVLYRGDDHLWRNHRAIGYRTNLERGFAGVAEWGGSGWRWRSSPPVGSALRNALCHRREVFRGAATYGNSGRGDQRGDTPSSWSLTSPDIYGARPQEWQTASRPAGTFIQGSIEP